MSTSVFENRANLVIDPPPTFPNEITIRTNMEEEHGVRFTIIYSIQQSTEDRFLLVEMQRLDVTPDTSGNPMMTLMPSGEIYVSKYHRDVTIEYPSLADIEATYELAKEAYELKEGNKKFPVVVKWQTNSGEQVQHNF